MTAEPRLRQVALVARDCEAVAGRLRETFGWGEPYHDPGVAEFGLKNAVFAAGDTFVEVVAPIEDGTTAGRYLERRGGDGGYMAIFQVPDLDGARRRLDQLGVRVVWKTDLSDIACTHLHPKDVPGAIVSLDWADPPESWRWAGPRWTGGAPDRGRGGVTDLTIEVAGPKSTAERWAAVLGVAARGDDNDSVVELAEAGQRLRFVPVAPGRGEGITGIGVAGWPADQAVRIGGVTFH
jgi:Glyoxalase-like domain